VVVVEDCTHFGKGFWVKFSGVGGICFSRHTYLYRKINSFHWKM
jgi:hypothetical protein